jgi:S-methylmethionine-dependent homocysteine/selenocysteine methylase
MCTAELQVTDHEEVEMMFENYLMQVCVCVNTLTYIYIYNHVMRCAPFIYQTTQHKVAAML